MAKHDNVIVPIAEGRTSLGKVTNKSIGYGQLIQKLTTRFETKERLKQYLALPKEQQDQLKNVNGYWIGGNCKDGRRKKANLGPRHVLTLDLDNITVALFLILAAGGGALKGYDFVIHTTRKHQADKPRCRLVILLKRPVLTDEYEALARLVAQRIDASMEAIDDVSYRPAQMMYWPSCSIDSEFIGRHFEGKPVDPDAVFDAYRKRGLDPFNYQDLPFAESQGQKRQAAAKAEDPFEKDGIIGAFCRTYPIEEAIAEFLSDTYGPGDMSGPKPRYTYLLGTTTNGIEIQDDGRFMYSHHTSDPCSDQLVNSFDAVRLVRFGHMDDAVEEGVPIGKRPSFKAMSEFAGKIDLVRTALAEWRFGYEEGLRESFDDLGDDPDPVAPPERLPSVAPSRTDAPLLPADLELLGPVEADDDITSQFEDLGPDPDAPTVAAAEKKDLVAKNLDRPPEDWFGDLDVTGKGGIKNTVANIAIILQNDARFFRRFAYNELMEEVVLRYPITAQTRFGVSVTVRDKRNGDPIEDHILTVIRTILESPPGDTGKGYGMPVAGKGNVDDALSMIARKHAFHPVKEMLEMNPWDGEEHLATVLQRYFLVEDNVYTRQAFRLAMVALVARVFEPGCKFDQMLVLAGEQGTGKSSFLEIIGRGSWYARFDADFNDPKACVEKMKGHPILEVAEMSSFNRSNMDDFKSILSGTRDTVRMAYARKPQTFLRRSVFFGTVNGEHFLRDLTGNRRVWPVVSKRPRLDTIDFEALAAETPQLWAEAYAIYLQMRKAKPMARGDLFLDMEGEAARIAMQMQDAAMVETEVDHHREDIEHWIETPVLSSDIADPNADLGFDNLDAGPSRLVLRARVTLREVWQLALREDPRFFKGGTVHRVRESMDLVAGWSSFSRKVKVNGQAVRVFYRDGTLNSQGIPVPYIDLPGADDDLIG